MVLYRVRQPFFVTGKKIWSSGISDAPPGTCFPPLLREATRILLSWSLSSGVFNSWLICRICGSSSSADWYLLCSLISLIIRNLVGWMFRSFGFCSNIGEPFYLLGIQDIHDAGIKILVPAWLVVAIMIWISTNVLPRRIVRWRRWCTAARLWREITGISTIIIWWRSLWSRIIHRLHDLHHFKHLLHVLDIACKIARQETAHAFHHFFGTFRVTVEPAGGNIVRVVEALHQGADFLIFD